MGRLSPDQCQMILVEWRERSRRAVGRLLLEDVYLEFWSSHLGICGELHTADERLTAFVERREPGKWGRILDEIKAEMEAEKNAAE